MVPQSLGYRGAPAGLWSPAPSSSPVSRGKYGAVATLLNPGRLRAVLRGLRADVRTMPPGKPDGALVEVAADRFESPEDAHDRFDRLRTALRDRDDRRAIFLTVYTRMTRDVRRALARGTFDNPDWMRDYVVTFADYYRRAFLAFEQGRVDAVPEPWRIAFGTSLAGDALVAQNAALGISAHINYDLALAVRDAGIAADRRSKYADHRRINEVLARLVDEQQRALADLYAPGINHLDTAFGRLDEAFSLFSMAEAREHAWRVAVVLTDFSLGVVERYARWVLRVTAVGAAAFVLAPGLNPTVHDAMRSIERGHVDLDTVLDRIEDRFDAAAPPEV